MPDTVDAKYLIANYDLFLVLEIVIFFSFPNYFALTLLFYLTPIFFFFSFTQDSESISSKPFPLSLLYNL